MCERNSKWHWAASLAGAVSLSLLFLFSSSALAAGTTGEPMYTISQSELEELSSSLMTLKKANEKSQMELSALRSELATSKKELNEARKQSAELMNELQQLRSQSQSQQVRLTNVNESLKQFAKEEQRTRLRIKAQRNTWEVVAAGLLVAWAAK